MKAYKTGDKRSELAQAKLLLMMAAYEEDIPDDKVYSTSGYWDDLMCYGPKSHDSAEMLKKYLTPEHGREIDMVLSKSDSGEI